MIYIVEVLERMLILAAKRLSMIALEEKAERWGAWMGTEGADIGKERREKLSTCKPPAVYQLQHETQTFITVLFKRAAAKTPPCNKAPKKKVVNFAAFCCCSADITVYRHAPFLKPGALEEVIYISGTGSVATFCLDMW